MNSEELYSRARTLLPGGVSSPVRAIRPYPFYTHKARDAYLYTVDGRTLIDCCLGYGPLLLGHRNPVILDAIHRQLEKGWLYGTPVPMEIELASRVRRDHPGTDMVRFVSTGGEATMSALRLARGCTGKKDIVKIEGGFHGAHDGVLIKAGSGATTLGIPDSAGVLPDLAAHTLQVPFNDEEALEDCLRANPGVAALILEPVMGNVGPILPRTGYLQAVREITRAHDVLLVFDEVITGYRIGIGGAQAHYQVTPDLTTLGKILGGGLPIGAVCGRRDLMEWIAPAGPVYQAGTFSGNPLSLAAGLATLDWLHHQPDCYARLAEATRTIQESIPPGAEGSFVRLGSMFKYFFRSSPPRDYREARESDTAAFGVFWERMFSRDVFLPPSQFETNFLSTAHRDGEIEQIGGAYRSCLSG